MWCRNTLSIFKPIGTIIFKLEPRNQKIKNRHTDKCTFSYFSPLIQKEAQAQEHKHIHPNSFSRFVSTALTLAMSQANGNSFSAFLCLVHLQYVFRWRLSTVKILLELEFLGQMDTPISTIFLRNHADAV